MSRPVDPLCPKGHVLEVVATAWPWFAEVPSCSICERPWARDAALGCNACHVLICEVCLRVGHAMQGGGAFADVLNPELAKELLSCPGFLRYKARCYYCRAAV